MNYALLFEEHIKVQRHAIRSSGIWSALFFIVGALLVISLFIGSVDKNLIIEGVKVGGGFMMSGVSLYQIKDVIQRRERIASYSYLKNSFEEAEHLPPELQQQLALLAMETLKDTIRR